jgi:alpha-amylase
MHFGKQLRFMVAAGTLAGGARAVRPARLGDAPMPAAVPFRESLPLSQTGRLLVRARVAAPEASNSSAVASNPICFRNDADPQYTSITIGGHNDAGIILQLTSVLLQNDVIVASAAINSRTEDGGIANVFQVTGTDGSQIPENRWAELQEQMEGVMKGSQRSSRPAIHGIAEADPSGKLSAMPASEVDTTVLENAANEVGEAAAALISLERELLTLQDSPDEGASMAVKQADRAEAASRLERRLAALQAVLTSRRSQMLEIVKEAEPPSIPDFMAPPPKLTTGPAAGNGYEIILQAFNWESCKENWYKKLANMVPEIAEAGFSAVWLPPASDSVSPQGYLPRDLYDLNSRYGTEAELRDLIATLHEHGLKAIADIVINHRCAHYQDDDGKWNKFGGRLAWDNTVICSNNPAFNGRGSYKNHEDYTAAPNLDHSQERVRKDIAQWMRYLRNSIGFDGWRFDFVKGYDGSFVGEYVNATVPEMAFGEYWDTCSYTDGVLAYNQDAHRQRTVDWCDATGGTCAAFDFTLKGILQEAFTRGEYWRLVDSQGRPPGVLGLWPSRAVTFLENHDTGSTLQHWPFPWKNVPEGYAYLLTHPGTPCVFYDHLMDPGHQPHIQKLLSIRRQYKLNNKSDVSIKKAYNDLYAAVVDKKLAVKIGSGSWSPSQEPGEVGSRNWELLHSGPNFAVWARN